MIFWLGTASFLSAFVSGITGMAGGTLLLSVLSIFYSPTATIALHGLLQVFANLSRILVFLRSVSKTHIVFFAVLAFPGAWMGAHLSTYFSPDLLKLLLGSIIIYVSLSTKKSYNREQTSKKIFIPLGFFSGFLGMIIGVTGPLLSPFFLRAGLVKEQFVATKACCQFIVQVIKVILFATMLQFDYSESISDIGLMIIGIFCGTFIAKWMFAYVSEKTFVIILKVILFVLGSKLIISALSVIVTTSM